MKSLKKIAMVGLVVMILSITMTSVFAGGHHGGGNRGGRGGTSYTNGGTSYNTNGGTSVTTRVKNVCVLTGAKTCTLNNDGFCAITGLEIADGSTVCAGICPNGNDCTAFAHSGCNFYGDGTGYRTGGRGCHN